MKEIIVGAYGFLGSNLRQYLKDQGKEVVTLPVEMLMDINSMHQFLLDQGEYHIYYLAAYGNLHGQSDIQEIYRAIVIKLLNVLEATQNTQCEGFVTTGTTSEYGNKLEPMKEDQLLEPRTFYAAAKAAATHLAQAWAIQNNFPIVVFRPASITGVGEQPIHLIPTLIRSCMFKEAIPFVSEPMHDYINVKDVCSAISILAEKAQDHKGEIFNVGSGVETSNRAVLEMIEAITGEKAVVNKAVKLNPQNISDVWIADSTKMQSLGWKPQVSLFENLKQMVVAI